MSLGCALHSEGQHLLVRVCASNRLCSAKHLFLQETFCGHQRAPALLKMLCEKSFRHSAVLPALQKWRGGFFGEDQLWPFVSKWVLPQYVSSESVPRRINVMDYNASIQMAELECLKKIILTNRKGGIFASLTYAKWSIWGAFHLIIYFMHSGS